VANTTDHGHNTGSDDRPLLERGFSRDNGIKAEVQTFEQFGKKKLITGEV